MTRMEDKRRPVTQIRIRVYVRQTRFMAGAVFFLINFFSPDETNLRVCVRRRVKSAVLLK